MVKRSADGFNFSPWSSRLKRFFGLSQDGVPAVIKGWYSKRDTVSGRVFRQKEWYRGSIITKAFVSCIKPEMKAFSFLFSPATNFSMQI